MNIWDTSRAAQRGVTLIELMVVVIVIAILASIAIPSYSQYVVKARRQVAAQELLTIASRQEQFFSDNKTYAVSIADLGYAADPIGTDENGELVDAGDASAMYSFTVSSTTASLSGRIRAYTLTAEPLGKQASDDHECGALTIDDAGLRKAGGSINDKCW